MTADLRQPHIDVASDFLCDALDLLERYKLTIPHFFASRSKRLKAYVDLRIAAECVLKAFVAYFTLAGHNRKTIINRLQGDGHKIDRLAETAQNFMSQDGRLVAIPFFSQVNSLPIGLRYRLDVFDFRDTNEELYYKTVGSNTWLDQLHGAVELLAREIDSHLSEHSRILSGEDIWELLSTASYNKYERNET